MPGTTGTGTGFVNASLGFRENIGALGGGNITIRAGADIQDLSVALPTNAVTQIVNGKAVLHEQNTGNLTIRAGGNIAGGAFYVEHGYAQLNTQGAITGGTQFSDGPVFAIGNAQFNVTAAGDLAVGTVLNPFVIAQAGLLSKSMDYFSSYTADSGISLQTLGGNLLLNNNASSITNQIQTCTDANCSIDSSDIGSFYNALNNPTATIPLLTMYPGNLRATALNGDLRINNSLSLYSAANSSFKLQASGDITFADNMALYQLDVEPSQLLPIAQPATTFDNATAYWLPSNYNVPGAHAAQPVHSADTTKNLIVSSKGNITAGTDALLVSAKATDISAAGDLTSLSLYLQNLNTNHQNVSSIHIGGNIIYPTQRNALTGNFSGSGFITQAGPGLLDIWAAGDIDLGVSGGITTIGARDNAALPFNGASVTLLAGSKLAGNSQPLTDYLQKYVIDPEYQHALSARLSVLLQQPASNNNQQLANSLEKLLAAISRARSDFPNTASEDSKLQLALSVLFNQFHLFAVEANLTSAKTAYQDGNEAIRLMFPDYQNSAAISLSFSQIQTLSGGSITLLAPGGALDVGLAASNISNNKTALGIVAQGQGNVNILTSGDVRVNQSRVFALAGGDITVWAANGNIDAGRGAKSASATEQPSAGYDANGNLILAYPPVISGSGIRSQSGYQNKNFGNVTLIAPNGKVYANEAGIGGNDVTIAATAVIGTGNIQAFGSTLGVPVSQTNFSLPDSVGNALASAGKSANDKLLEDENRSDAQQRANKAAKVALLNTQLIGFGICSVSDVRDAKPGCGGN